MFTYSSSNKKALLGYAFSTVKTLNCMETSLPLTLCFRVKMFRLPIGHILQISTCIWETPMYANLIPQWKEGKIEMQIRRAFPHWPFPSFHSAPLVLEQSFGLFRQCHDYHVNEGAAKH